MTQLTRACKLAAILASLSLVACGGGGSSSEGGRAVQGQGSGQDTFFDAALARIANSETSEPFTVEEFTATTPETGEPLAVGNI